MTDKQAAREERSGTAASGTGAGAAKVRDTREKRRDESRESRERQEMPERHGLDARPEQAGPAEPAQLVEMADAGRAAEAAAAERDHHAAHGDTAGSITNVANAPPPAPEFTVDVAPLDQLIAIRQEQARLDQFRDRAASMKAQVDESVFRRVVEDYTRRHRALEEKAAPLKVQARREYGTLQAWRARVESTHEDARLIKQELQFRHAVGELDEAALAVQVREPEETLARCAGELASIDALHARFSEAFGSAAALDAEMRAESAAPEGAEGAQAADRVDDAAGADRANHAQVSHEQDAAARAARGEAGEHASAGVGLAGDTPFTVEHGRGEPVADAFTPHLESERPASVGAAGAPRAGGAPTTYQADAAVSKDAITADGAQGAEGDAMRSTSSPVGSSSDAAAFVGAASDAVSGREADGSRRAASGFWSRVTAGRDANNGSETARGAHAPVEASAGSAIGGDPLADGDGARAPGGLAAAPGRDTLIAWPSNDGADPSNAASGTVAVESGSMKIPGDVLGLASLRETLPPERFESYRAQAARLEAADGADAAADRRGSSSGTHAIAANGVLLELIDLDPEEALAAGLTVGDAAQGAVRIGAPHPLGPSTTVGRADESQLRIPNPSVSRQHAIITATPDGYAIRDLHSQNGTFVNGERIDQAPLHDGDEVVFGDAPFLFRSTAAPR